MIKDYQNEIISSIIIITLMITCRLLIPSLVKSFAKMSQIIEQRTSLVIKYINLFITALGTLSLFIIWGIDPKNIYLALSTVFAFIGVALFAQWSILSNVTAGIILFFSFPFKIGDVIRVHDKDFPIEAKIEDIKAFHTYLKTNEGEFITYPNNLLLQKGITIVNNKKNIQLEDFTD